MSIDGLPIASLPASPMRPLLTEADEKSKPTKPSLLKIFRDSVGKDLTRMALPVYFNEPLSFLQRVAEDVEHYALLDQAANEDLVRTGKRAALVAAFLISHYAATAGRTGKPFNPLLGETFDLVLPKQNLAIVAEQVSHHPPIAAIHATGRGWVYHTAYRVQSRFHGNSLEVWPEGTVHIRFADGDHFCYEQAHTFVNNIVVGSMWIDNAGVVKIQDLGHCAFETSLKLKRCTSVFKESKSFGAVSGEVCSTKDSRVLHSITGNWRKEVRIDEQVVWTAPAPVSRKHTAGHTMTEWAWSLNCELDGSEKRAVPKTDSRLRPDERALEKGLYDVASQEKERLEKEQRQRRKTVDDGLQEDIDTAEDEGSARWFTLQPDERSGSSEWRYSGGYFSAKMAAVNGHDWPDDVPEIF